jgi:hypothetical protein
MSRSTWKSFLPRSGGAANHLKSIVYFTPVKERFLECQGLKGKYHKILISVFFMGLCPLCPWLRDYHPPPGGCLFFMSSNRELKQ